MTIIAGLVLFAAFVPYLVSGDAAAAAAAAAGGGRDSAAAAAAAAASGGGGAAAAAAAAASGGEYLPPPINCLCDLVYLPVCGSDGLTYSNECVLRCISLDRVKNGISPIDVLYNGQCKPLTCNCNSNYLPVCGSNNHTYTNECWLACTNNRRIQDGLLPIGLAYRRACSIPSCLCPDSIIPVCGTDGRTYRNICILQCYSRINIAQGKDPIYVKDAGACLNENCYCSAEKAELCASDDNTYLNQCVLDCQNRRLDQLGQNLLTVQYTGKCIKCPCTTDYNPVCANNDVTFGNLCLFLCENEKRRAAGQPELMLRWSGVCSCGCTNDYRPICASNGRTYANRCLLRCENRKRYQDRQPLLKELGEGECQQCNCNYCPPGRRPVCGSDNKTYWNVCYFNCNNDCRENVGLPLLWIVNDSEC